MQCIFTSRKKDRAVEQIKLRSLKTPAQTKRGSNTSQVGLCGVDNSKEGCKGFAWTMKINMKKRNHYTS